MLNDTDDFDVITSGLGEDGDDKPHLCMVYTGFSEFKLYRGFGDDYCK